MAIIDLSTRITTDWTLYNKYKASSDSYIYISEEVNKDAICSTSMDLHVGDKCFNPDKNEEFFIPDSGLFIKPKETVIISTRSKIALPFNIFGVVTGKGNYIYQGGFISTGKINPGFCDCLLIGFFNGSSETILLKKENAFASVYFITTETELSQPYEYYRNRPSPKKEKLSLKRKFFFWFKNNWHLIIPIFLSIIAILISIFFKK
jgi:deoxycytidine triphosphate deaminase